MFKSILGVCLAIFLTGCVGGSTSVKTLVTPKKNDKSAELVYTKQGITSEFEFKGIIKGTYKDVSSTSGIIAHSGTRSIKLTTKLNKTWSVNVRSEKKGYRPYGNIAIDVDEPYVATIKEGKKNIGEILLGVEGGVNAKNSLIKTVGLNALVNTNLKFVKSKAKILGVNYTIKSVFKDKQGTVNSNPIGYKVFKGKKLYGVVVVGKNAFGGRTMSIWLKSGQSKSQQQSVATILTVVGYSSLPL